MKNSIQTASKENAGAYEGLSVQEIIQLAAPQTWTATLLPFLMIISTLYLQKASDLADMPLIACLFLACICLQSAVNTRNDYEDYIKGADTLASVPDPFEATLLRKNINPAQVSLLSHCFVVIAGISAVYPLYKGGIPPLILGLVGIFVVYAYSSGKLPLSYLPVGELVSGICMGLLMPVGVALCISPSLAGNISEFIYLIGLLLPQVLSIALIMLTNNACDREKDMLAGRNTLVSLLEQRQVRVLYKGIMLCILILTYSIPIFSLVGAIPVGSSMEYISPRTCNLFIIALLTSLLLILPLFIKLASNPLVPTSRIAAMSQCSLFYSMISLSTLLLLFIASTM